MEISVNARSKKSSAIRAAMNYAAVMIFCSRVNVGVAVSGRYVMEIARWILIRSIQIFSIDPSGVVPERPLSSNTSNPLPG
jgi:hypothetical protein